MSSRAVKELLIAFAASEVGLVSAVILAGLGFYALSLPVVESVASTAIIAIVAGGIWAGISAWRNHSWKMNGNG